jgi:hypothetical protein
LDELENRAHYRAHLSRVTALPRRRLELAKKPRRRRAWDAVWPRGLDGVRTIVLGVIGAVLAAAIIVWLRLK